MIRKRNIFARYLVAGLLFSGLFIMLGQVAHADTYVRTTGCPVNIRSQPVIDPANRITTVPRSTRVRIVGISGDFFRGYLAEHGYIYISREWVEFYRTIGTVTESDVWVYNSQDPDVRERIHLTAESDTFRVVSYYGNWYQVIFQGESAFIRRRYIDIPCDLLPVPSIRPNCIGGNNESSSSGSVRDDVVAMARRYVGRPYRWGGNGPDSFDCSGFVGYIMRHFGVDLPRRSRDMASSGTHVARSDMLPGDLMFFATGGGGISHVGLYIGGGEMIHASTSRSGVVLVSVDTAYWRRVFVTARRVL